MGLDTAAAMFLCGARGSGVDFSRTTMIGRQWFFPEVGALERVFSALGLSQDAGNFWQANEYSEGFFSLLGAQQVSSVDISDFEGATHIHDMNQPLPDSLRGRFSVVYDGGTLEHIFHFVQALKNCMQMVEVGGHFVQVNNANNFMGHGFWQISPELIYRVFDAANGFQVKAVLLHEVVPGGGWYAVADPERMHGRVGLCNARPTYIATIARKVAEAEIFATVPQQSDYVGAWGGTGSGRPAPATLSGLRRQIPRPIRRFLKDVLVFRKMGLGQDCFRRISEESLLRGHFT
jgi:hypothetical protein